MTLAWAISETVVLTCRTVWYCAWGLKKVKMVGGVVLLRYPLSTTGGVDGDDLELEEML